MNKRYCIDVKEVPIKDIKKKKEISTTKPFSIEMFILAVIVSIFLFPNMWKEWKANNSKINYPSTTQQNESTNSF